MFLFFLRASRVGRTALFVVLLITAFSFALGASPGAADQLPLPPLRSLALPRSIFPRHASVRGAPSTMLQASRAIPIHRPAINTPNRPGGYLQSATWWQGRYYVALWYSASVFNTANDAAAARVDADASLIEIGEPVRLAGSTLPAFRVFERDGHVDLMKVWQQGAIETEVMLRLQRGAPLWVGLSQLRLSLVRARQAITRYAARIPPATPPPTPATPPGLNPYISPWGTGPVVKSPSLMVLAPSMMPAGAVLDSGSFRPQSPPLASRAYLHAALVPPGFLSRYAITGTIGNGPLYNTVSLYPSTQAAADAFNALQTANDHKPWMQAVDVSAFVPPPDTDVTAWRGHAETMAVIRSQNVLTILVSQSNWAGLTPLVTSMLATVPTWFHAQGTQIVDAAGNPVRLMGLNWYGAESPDYVVGGLDYQPYESILDTIQRSGYNTIRVPFSNQLVEQNPVITDHLGANRELAGLHALDILDRIINYAGAIGLRVVLDDHRSEAGWSSQESGLWYTDAYPDSAFQQDWSTMAARYAVNNVVIGSDLRNEPHAAAAWGGPDPTTDWHGAAQRAGDLVLATNPHLLVIVEGVQFFGDSGSYWWGGNLMGVAGDPVVLQFPDSTSARSQLVYSAHDYGPDDCGIGCPWFNATTTTAALQQLWEEHWGYITADPSQPYAAPVWLGEFGTCNTSPACGYDTTPGSQGQWFSSLIQYVAQKQLGWAYWSVNGSESTGPTREYGALEWYGFLSQDWTAPYPWLAQELSAIQTPLPGATTIPGT